MNASIEFRQQEMSSGDTKEKEKCDDLSLLVDFTGPNLNLDFLQESNDFPAPLDSGGSEYRLLPETKSMIHGQDPVADNLLNSENDATDYHWLLSPPHNSIPANEMKEQKAPTSHSLSNNGQSTSLDSGLENCPTDGTSTTNIAPKLQASSNGIKSSSGSIRRSSPVRKGPSTVSRSATPTPRPTLTSTTKPSRSSTPTSRPTVAAMKPVAPTRSARSSTPTPRPSILAAPSKPTSRSSTSTPRPSIIAASKSTSRSSTPTQRPSNPSGLLVTSVNGGRSSSVIKGRAPSLKNSTSLRGSSPSVKSRPSKNLPEAPGFATEAPPNTKKSSPDRPASASRGRLPTAVKLPVTETNSKAIPKRSSSTPSRRQVSNGSANNIIKSGLTRSRGFTNVNDDVNPVLMGTKMVERVVNMRKLAPPRQDHDQNNTSGKLSVSQDNSGFGRTLSKKSFDMAMRHLDIRRSMPGNMRAMITKVPASSVYSVRSESTKTQNINASDSTLDTSSSASSGHSIGNNPSYVDGNEISQGSENGHSYHYDQ